MGRAGKWLRTFLSGRKGRDKSGPLAPAAEPDLALPGTASTTTPASTPGAKEKRRWSFRRPAATAASPGPGSAGKADAKQGRLAPYGFLEPRAVDPDQHAVAVAIATAAAAEAAMAAKQAAAAAVRLSASAPGSRRAAVIGIDEAAAIKIQAAFRSYLARKALCALRGLVKLQALVRGHLVRRQASHTLRCMQAIVAAQNRARAARLRMLDDDDKPAVVVRTPRTTPSRRSSPHHPRLRHHQEMAEENVKIVEVDTGGGAGAEAHGIGGTPRASSRRSSCYATPLCRTPSKNELYYQKTISPTPSALTDASARTYSGRYDDFSFAAAAARASPFYRYTPSRHQQQHHDDDKPAAEHEVFVPGYMANTESSRAKARSQSAPRQRLSVSSAAELSGRRRASLEAQAAATPGARGVVVATATPRYGYGLAAGARVQRCPSQASAPGGACPWGARLDRWSASAHDSECGSTSTVMTAATTTYCWSLATDTAGVA